MINNVVHTDIACDHCGDACINANHNQGALNFCCNGCKMVYSLLHDNGMGDYYRYEKTPGISQRTTVGTTYDYLDNTEIVDKLLSFSEGDVSKVVFNIPQIHCSSCLWLLEHLDMLNGGVTKSSVNFVSKKATITFKNTQVSLRQLVELLSKIGYEPSIHYDQLDEVQTKAAFDKKLIYKLGLAGFCFGNIMLLSFPEYLGFDKASYLFHIGYINILLALPVLLYSGVDYLKSAYIGIKMRDINIDLPIALGMLALFLRSIYEIIGQHGEGYLDSFSGFIFFLLIGRWFQSYTYKAIDFDRNYKSYFPISTYVLKSDRWESISLNHIVAGDIIRIRNQELIPADGILYKGRARVDYSFVTGESDLISKNEGQKLYAGGRHQGDVIELEVTQSVDQSYLTQLWNEDAFKQHTRSRSSGIITQISSYFTFTIIALALCTMGYWITQDASIAFNAFTAVLIVACPCALALAIPFTYGNILRLLSLRGVYLRNVDTIEYMQEIDYVIFDKTGTITDNNEIEVSYHGTDLSKETRSMIKSACSQSSHPLSKAIANTLSVADDTEVSNYTEVLGSGFEAKCGSTGIKVGSANYIFNGVAEKNDSGVFIEIDGVYIGCFKFNHAFRDNLGSVMSYIKKHYKVVLLSGDTDQDKDRVATMLGIDIDLHFGQTPKDKLNKIKELQNKGHKVLMIGDGLNDAGALKQADVGLVISDDSSNFSPACDGILSASEFSSLHLIMCYLRKAQYIIYGAFVLAFMYNSIGLYYAMSVQLSPVIAAVLMPLSSVTVILYGVVSSWYLFTKVK